MRQQSVCNFALIFIVVSVISPDFTLSAPHLERRSLELTGSDYVLSEQDYQQLLDRLQREANDSIASDPRNYLDGDLPIDEIVRMIEVHSTTANPITINDASMDSLIRGQIISTERVPDLTTKDELSAENLVSPPRNYPPPERSEVSTMSDKADTTTAKPECPICLEPIDIRPSETTPCAHKFHSDCLRTWNTVVSRQQQL